MKKLYTFKNGPVFWPTLYMSAALSTMAQTIVDIDSERVQVVDCYHTVLPATHTRTIPTCFYSLATRRHPLAALWLVLIAPTHEVMARLS